MRLTFVQMSVFAADWRRLKLGDEDLRALELALLERPDAGRIIPGGGGLRRIRFAPPTWHRGKRGAARVCYAYVMTAQAVYLLAAYGKNEQEDITPADMAGYRRLMLAIKQEIAERGPSL